LFQLVFNYKLPNYPSLVVVVALSDGDRGKWWWWWLRWFWWWWTLWKFFGERELEELEEEREGDVEV
jgi:hypothetical protein